MNDSIFIHVATLWFVILIFIQTGSDTTNGLMMAIRPLAILLAFVIPFVVFLLLLSIFFGEYR